MAASSPTSFTPDIVLKLADKFEHIKWRPQKIIASKKNGKSYGIMVAYIDSRDIIDRLNDVVGPQNWNFSWHETNAKDVVKGRLELFGSIREDVGYPNSNADENPLKSAVSDAIKRCAVQYGVGRFLYSLKNELIEYDPVTKRPINENDLKKLENMFKPIGTVVAQ